MKNFNTELTPSEAGNIIKYMITQNVELANNNHMPVALNIEGNPGIAKTSVVKQICEELNTHHYIRLNVAEMEIGDLTGFPITEYKVCKGEECMWIGDKLLNDYLLQGYHAIGDSRMSYAKPEWLVGKEDKPVVLILDDYNRGMGILMNACMRITDEQQYVSWGLPKGSSVILTSNPEDSEESFNVSTLDSAQKTRFLTIKMKPSVNDWAVDYAEKVGLPSPFINFMLKHPEIIEGASVDENGNAIKKGNLRIWSKFFHAVSGLSNNLSDNWGTVFLLGQNSLPVEHLLMLNKFIEDKLDQIPTPEQLLNSQPEDAIKALKSVIGSGSKKRIDISSILSRRIINYTLVNHKKFSKDMVNTYAEIMESEYMSPDLVLLSVKKTTKLFPQLISRPKLISILTT
jgi:hypothetical protein